MEQLKARSSHVLYSHIWEDVLLLFNMFKNFSEKEYSTLRFLKICITIKIQDNICEGILPTVLENGWKDYTINFDVSQKTVIVS